LFYNAGFVVLAPLVFACAAQTGQPVVYLALAMAAPLSITHGFLPPHPGPVAIAQIFGADQGKTLLFGLAAALPAVLLAGVVFPDWVKNTPSNPPDIGQTVTNDPERPLPGKMLSFGLALLPVVLMLLGAWSSMVLPEDATLKPWLVLAGDPGMALLVAVLLTLGVFYRQHPALINQAMASVSSAASILFVIAGGGVFKQVLIDSGMAADVGAWFESSALSPLFLGWLAATALRITLGSATVAGMTAAGMVQPLVAAGQVSPELMTLAIGAGSLMCSHVNDTGFWMFKEYFGLSIRDTFRTWTLMETLVGLSGLLAVLCLNEML
jgi:Gnt-I system high-affinity gluconate transporter/Gnt-II system L-idonate transporter